MILAEWTVGQAVWAVFWGALFWTIFIAWIVLVVQVFGDIMRNSSLKGPAKAVWALFVLAIPLLGVFLYMIVNGEAMHERQLGMRP